MPRKGDESRQHLRFIDVVLDFEGFCFAAALSDQTGTPVKHLLQSERKKLLSVRPRSRSRGVLVPHAVALHLS